MLLSFVAALTPPPLPPRTCDPFPLYFDRDSAALTADGRQMVEVIVDAYVRRPELVEISGHADDYRDERANLRLSRRRVEAVFRLLVERGVPVEQIRSVSVGSRLPAVSGRDPQNRRVQLAIGCSDQVANEGSNR